MNWNTRNKLLTGLVIMIILAVITGGLGYFTFSQIYQQQNILVTALLLLLTGIGILALANWLGHTVEKMEETGVRHTRRLEKVIDINQADGQHKKSPAKWRGSLRLRSGPLNGNHDVHALEFQGKP